MSLPYFVTLISFIKCAKKLLTVIKSPSMSDELFVNFFFHRKTKVNTTWVIYKVIAF